MRFNVFFGFHIPISMLQDQPIRLAKMPRRKENEDNDLVCSVNCNAYLF